MSQSERLYIAIYNLNNELNEYGAIPSYHHKELEDNLVIACKEPGRQPRKEVPRERKQILANSRKNKAHKVYLQVVDVDCHVLLSFILVISPRACVSFDLHGFFRYYADHQWRLKLNIETKGLLEEIGERQGLIQNPHYNKLMKSLFPPGGFQTENSDGCRFYPSSEGDGELHVQTPPSRIDHIEYRYSQTSISRIPVLGDRLFDAVQASTQWRQERKTGGLTTDCLIALIPRSQNEDISFIFSVGHKEGLEIINQLQPEEVSEVDQPITEQVQLQRLIDVEIEKEIKYKCSHIAISRASVLGNIILDAVQASARWKQERKGGRATTDCLVVLIPRSQNVDISINVLVGHKKGLELINQLQLEPI